MEKFLQTLLRCFKTSSSVIQIVFHKQSVEFLSVFKVAAGTLDASTKIYAVRVDAVHADAYRVLGGLGSETKPGEGASPVNLISMLFVGGFQSYRT